MKDQPATRALPPDGAAAVLEALLAAHPELRDEAEDLARETLSAVDLDAVAAEVRAALLAIPLTAIGGRAGRQRGRGYVEPDEAASMLLEEALEPFLDEIARRGRAGLSEAGVEYGLAVLAALYALRDHDGDDSALRWVGADQETWELATSVVLAWDGADIPAPSACVDELCPGWAGIAG